ncbi:NADPH-dependent ferric siderophore reductase [Rhizobium sp. BK196]|uniref:siderophore-interacting protein n=1 Tax=Rhizobium sp. BK196 TaxID=2587073 RepID=UPI0016072FB4|nr:SIP domain-containing protein [Rhizobium sp. BK196]MBB3310323.1 NADPH-dependent ferric siderophore reductase [Rhizobium sp. BK196]
MDNNRSINHQFPAPVIERVRHELRRRSLTVESVTDITPGMRRIVLTGEDLADFTSLAPLPAIGRRIEESGADTTIVAIAAVAGPEEEQSFETAAALTTRWVYRPLFNVTDAEPLIAALAGIDIVPQTFVWIAAEASVVRSVRAYRVEERGYPLSWIKASGYWVKGKADTTEKF